MLNGRRGAGIYALAPLLPVLLLLAGCSFAEYRRAQVAEQKGDWDEAVLFYLQLVQKQPDDLSYRSALMRARIKASQAHFEAGKKFADAQSLERALFEYRQAVELDSTNQYAATELEKVRQAIAARQRQQGELRTIEEMKKEAQERSQVPLLEPRSKQPISLEFPNAVPIKDIYRALGKAFGINVLFDPNLKDQEIAIELKDVTAQDALEILMRAAQHFYKVMDSHTILIAADTPQNRRAYENLVIQTFFLSNSDVKEVLTMLRTLVDAKKLAANERLNAIILKETIDKVKIAERLIQTNDKARAEVVIDVELLQIDSNKLRELGTALSQYSISQGFAPGLDIDTTTPGTQLTLDDLRFLNRQSWSLTIPSFLYNFTKTNSNAQVLARPQLRISEGEKAALVIGDKVPIPTTTFNTSNTVGGSIVPITSFQYQDVGIKINIEPRVHHNLEVTLKLHVEVSNLNGTVPVGQGQEQPVIGTRQVDTVIRLKDGETNFLAGLLRTDESNSGSGVPGLSEIPILGRLFSRDRRQASRTDVILTMTPHIIRRSDITEADLVPMNVGTDQNPSFRGPSPRVESEVEDGPFDEGAAAADRVRELIRQRVQELPPGLDEGFDTGVDTEEVEPPEEQPKEPPPQGIDLVPPPFPTPTPQPEEPEQPQGTAQRLSPQEDTPVDTIEPSTASAALATAETDGGAANAAASVALDAADGPAPSVVPAASSTQRAAAKVRLRLVPGVLEVAVGDRFELRVEADARVPLSHLPLILTYDPQVVQPLSWDRGALLGAAGEAELLGAVGPPGRLLLGVSRLGDRPGVTGKGTVAVITFEARKSGSSGIRLERPKALGPALEELQPVAAQGAQVRVVLPVPPGPDARRREEGPHA